MTTNNTLPAQDARGKEKPDVQCKPRSRERTATARTPTLGKAPAYGTRNAAPFAKPGSQKRMDACDQRLSLTMKPERNRLLNEVGAKSCLKSTRTTCRFMNNGSVNCTGKPAINGWHAMPGAAKQAQNAQTRSRVSSVCFCRDRSRSEYGGQLLLRAISALPERHTTMSTGEQTSPNSTYSDMLRAAFADHFDGGEGRA